MFQLLIATVCLTHPLYSRSQGNIWGYCWALAQEVVSYLQLSHNLDELLWLALTLFISSPLTQWSDSTKDPCSLYLIVSIVSHQRTFPAWEITWPQSWNLWALALTTPPYWSFYSSLLWFLVFQGYYCHNYSSLRRSSLSNLLYSWPHRFQDFWGNSSCHWCFF